MEYIYYPKPKEEALILKVTLKSNQMEEII
jgi:hypothetical protein